MHLKSCPNAYSINLMEIQVYWVLCVNFSSNWSRLTDNHLQYCRFHWIEKQFWYKTRFYGKVLWYFLIIKKAVEIHKNAKQHCDKMFCNSIDADVFVGPVLVYIIIIYTCSYADWIQNHIKLNKYLRKFDWDADST